MEGFIGPMRLTKNAVAKSIGVPATRIGEIVRVERAVSADTDLRLVRFFSASEGYWLARQMEYDLEVARRAGHYDGIPKYVA